MTKLKFPFPFFKIMKQEEFLKKFGAHYKKLRKEKRLSLREMELRGPLSRQFLSNMENGKVNFTFYKVKQLADLLEISVEEMFEGFKY